MARPDFGPTQSAFVHSAKPLEEDDPRLTQARELLEQMGAAATLWADTGGQKAQVYESYYWKLFGQLIFLVGEEAAYLAVYGEEALAQCQSATFGEVEADAVSGYARNYQRPWEAGGGGGRGADGAQKAVQAHGRGQAYDRSIVTKEVPVIKGFLGRILARLGLVNAVTYSDPEILTADSAGQAMETAKRLTTELVPDGDMAYHPALSSAHRRVLAEEQLRQDVYELHLPRKTKLWLSAEELQLLQELGVEGEIVETDFKGYRVKVKPFGLLMTSGSLGEIKYSDLVAKLGMVRK